MSTLPDATILVCMDDSTVSEMVMLSYRLDRVRSNADSFASLGVTAHATIDSG